MRKIDLVNYAIEGGMYDVKGSLQTLLYSPELGLGYKELFDNHRVAKKIKLAEDSVLLEEADYQILKRVTEAFKGYSRNEVELIQRVLEAPEVSIKEA